MKTEVQIEKIQKEDFSSLERGDWFYITTEDDAKLYIKINDSEAMRFWTKVIVTIDPTTKVILIDRVEIKVFV